MTLRVMMALRLMLTLKLMMTLVLTVILWCPMSLLSTLTFTYCLMGASQTFTYFLIMSELAISVFFFALHWQFECMRLVGF